MKLHEVLAILPSLKSRLESEITSAHHAHKKPASFDGMSRRYQPLADDGEVFPSESKKPEKNTTQTTSQVRKIMTEAFNFVSCQDRANCVAKADIKVGEELILRDVPATHLLYLGHQLEQLETFVSEIPTLPDDVAWSYDANSDLYRTEEVASIKTAKLEYPVVLAEATEHHPAQVQLRSKDETIGHWHTTKFSGAMPAQEKRQILERVRSLREAVAQARAKANDIEVDNPRSMNDGQSLLGYIFDGK